MAQQFDVASATGKCAATGRPLEEGEEFYAVLFDSGDTFVREDYALEAWQGPPDNAFCYFRSRVPAKEKKKQLLVNNEVLIHFFQRLAEETEPARVQFRFVLALILTRKRLLKYEGTAIEDGTEVWQMTLTHDHTPHKVVNPQLTDEQIEGVSRQLSAILHSDMGTWAEEADPQPGEETPGPSTDEASRTADGA